MPRAVCRAARPSAGRALLSGARAAPPAFSPLVLAGMIGGGLACFAAFAVLLAFSTGRNEADGGAHALSRSAIGFAGVVQLLQDTGSQVLVSRAPALGDSPNAKLLVLTPAPTEHSPPTMPHLAARTVLIVLPKWRANPAPRHPGWVARDEPLPAGQVLSVLPADWVKPTLRRRPAAEHPDLQAGLPLGAVPSIAHVQRLQTLAATGWTAVLRDAAGGIVLGRHEQGPYVLADPDLLSNLALADLAGATGAVTLLTTLADGQPIAFDVSLNGLGRSRELLRLVFEPPLLGATLCAVAAAALIGLLSVRRFGPVRVPDRTIAAGKRALADNSAGLIALARREPNMARPYAELTRGLAARATAAPRRLSPAEMDAHLDRAAAMRGLPDRFTALLADADAVRDRVGLVRLADRLHRWRMGLIHGHR